MHMDDLSQQIGNLEQHDGALQAVLGDLQWRQSLVPPGSAVQRALRAKLTQVQQERAAVRTALATAQHQRMHLLADSRIH